MTNQVYVAPATVVAALRRLMAIKFSRTERVCLMGLLALHAKAGGKHEVELVASGAGSVESQLLQLFGVAPGTELPLVNPFGMRERRLEYLRPGYSRSGVYTHLYPGRSLDKFFPSTKTDEGLLVTLPEGAAAKIAEVKVPLEPALAFLLRREAFPEGADVAQLVERARTVLGLDELAMHELFEPTPDFAIEFSPTPFGNTLADLPPDLQPPLPVAADHAASAHAARSIVPTAPRGAVKLAIDPNIQRRLRGAFRAAKAIALVGPPGTAKSWMLEDVLEAAAADPASLGLAEAPSYDRHTAEVDWSARTVIGGYYPQADGRLVWQDGHLLRAIREGRSLWIEEMNRADLDRVLGPALTFLAGQQVDLGPTHLAASEDAPSKPMLLVWGEDADSGVLEDEHQRVYYAGRDWRLLGTYNNTDLGRVFPMGAALTRRWAIVPVAPLAAEQLPAVLDDVAGLPESAASLITLVYSLHLGEIPLGPAPFIDMARYVAANVAADESDVNVQLQDAYVLHLAQQLKRLDVDRREAFMDRLAGILGRDLSNELARL
ncbi:AAA family ATPase [Duganella sp.]|uniref:AAA family ATPase n=1 Tax=Duganella sp. TaxID=1904440 RepID=UPI0031DA02AC